MGGSSSKPNSGTTNVQSSSMESSEGFHMLEVHFPTLGAGFGLVVLGALILYFCIARRKRGDKRRQQQIGRPATSGWEPPHTVAPSPHWPPPMCDPSVARAFQQLALTYEPLDQRIQRSFHQRSRIAEIEDDHEEGSSKRPTKKPKSTEH